VRAIKAELKSTGNGVYLSVDNYNSYSFIDSFIVNKFITVEKGVFVSFFMK
jgi:hypothetical protein